MARLSMVISAFNLRHTIILIKIKLRSVTDIRSVTCTYPHGDIDYQTMPSTPYKYNDKINQNLPWQSCAAVSLLPNDYLWSVSPRSSIMVGRMSEILRLGNLHKSALALARMRVTDNLSIS